MGSKVFLLLGLLMAIVLISSKVAARDLAETSTDFNQNVKEAKGTNGFDGAKDNDGGYGGCPGGSGGYGGYPDGSGGGYCRYGCCCGSYYGRVCRCCSYAEAVQAKVQPKN